MVREGRERKGRGKIIYKKRNQLLEGTSVANTLILNAIIKVVTLILKKV